MDAELDLTDKGKITASRPSGQPFTRRKYVGESLLESVTVPLHLIAYVSKAPPLYNVLGLQPPGAVLEWPQPRASAIGRTDNPLYMYFSTFHWQPLASGYSGNYPASFITLPSVISSSIWRGSTPVARRVSRTVARKSG